MWKGREPAVVQSKNLLKACYEFFGNCIPMPHTEQQHFIGAMTCVLVIMYLNILLINIFQSFLPMFSKSPGFKRQQHSAIQLVSLWARSSHQLIPQTFNYCAPLYGLQDTIVSIFSQWRKWRFSLVAQIVIICY